MKIFTKGRYALRLMVDLAQHAQNRYVPLKEIAMRQNISDKYLEQIVIQLNKAGYLKSIRGAQGGYALTKDPSEYTVGMILRLMEGGLAPVPCIEENATPCPRMKKCSTVGLWLKLKEAIEDVVDHCTVADLAQDSQDLDSSIVACDYIFEMAQQQ